MTKIFGLMVVKNESSRYLQSVLKHLSWYLDDIVIVDDRSSDGTPRLASDFARVQIRPDDVPPFMEDESAFRQFSWLYLEDSLNPSSDDWILSIDADEFIIADHPRDDLLDLTKVNDIGVQIRIPELWNFNPPQIRVDGFWNKNMSPRFFRYMPGGTFSGKKMGCPPFPTYVKTNSISEHLEILHVGYAHKDDIYNKYERYSNISIGHSSQHIASIIKKPTLIDYNRHIPNIYRGNGG